MSRLPDYEVNDVVDLVTADGRRVLGIVRSVDKSSEPTVYAIDMLKEN